MVKVFFPSSLRQWTEGQAEVEMEAATVRSLITALDQRFPGIGRELDEGTSVSINGEIMADALYEKIPEGAEIHFLPTLSGG